MEGEVQHVCGPNFAYSHVCAETVKNRMGAVGMWGEYCKHKGHGKFVEWQQKAAGTLRKVRNRTKGSLKVSLSAQTIYTIQFSQKIRQAFPPHTQIMGPKGLLQWSLSPSSRAALLPNTSTGVVGDRPIRPFSAHSGRARTASAACQPSSVFGASPIEPEKVGPSNSKKHAPAHIGRRGVGAT